MSCGVGRRRGSDPALLWLWCRRAPTAPVRPLAWEPPCAAGAAIKRTKNGPSCRTLNIWMSSAASLSTSRAVRCDPQVMACPGGSPAGTGGRETGCLRMQKRLQAQCPKLCVGGTDAQSRACCPRWGPLPTCPPQLDSPCLYPPVRRGRCPQEGTGGVWRGRDAGRGGRGRVDAVWTDVRLKRVFWDEGEAQPSTGRAEQVAHGLLGVSFEALGELPPQPLERPLLDPKLAHYFFI